MVAGACAGALAPSASAATWSFYFDARPDGPSSVGVSATTVPASGSRLEVVRAGAVIALSPVGSGSFFAFASVDVPSLAAGDVATLYSPGAPVASVTYDGMPAIGADACVGHSGFTANRSADATVDSAGAYVPGADPYGPRIHAIWTQANPFAVTLDRPLAVGDVAYADTTITGGATDIYSQRAVNVGACPAPPPVPAAPAAAPAAPTDAQVLVAVKAALAATAKKLKTLDPAALARKRSIALSFVFSEPGTARLLLTTKVKRHGKKAKVVVIGTGTKVLAVAGKANVTVKFTSAGHRLLKASKRLKVTLKGTFTPKRAGATAQKTSTSVTLKRKKRH